MKNPYTQQVLGELKRTAIENKTALWKRIASEMEKPTRQKRIVNIFQLEKHSKDGETIVVPGKVLGEGDLSKKITVAAQSFSAEAKRKIDAKGSTMTIEELMRKNPKAEKVRIIG